VLVIRRILLRLQQSILSIVLVTVDACQPFRKSLLFVIRRILQRLQQSIFFGLVGLGHRSAYHCSLIGRQSMNRSAYPCIMVVHMSYPIRAEAKDSPVQLPGNVLSQAASPVQARRCEPSTKQKSPSRH